MFSKFSNKVNRVRRGTDETPEKINSLPMESADLPKGSVELMSNK